MNTTTNSHPSKTIQSQQTIYKQRYRVELMTATTLRPEDNIITIEVLAKGVTEATTIAIELIQKEFPTTPWIKIEPWFVEKME
jgi:hypothetical protein